MSMSGGSTQAITVAATPTVVLPSRPGRKSLGVHNRNGNASVSMISNGSQGFNEGCRVLADQTLMFNSNDDGVARVTGAIVMISESGNNVVDVVESY